MDEQCAELHRMGYYGFSFQDQNVDFHSILTPWGFIATGVAAHGLYPSRDGKQLYVATRRKS